MALARFMEPDPYDGGSQPLLPQTWNRYAYVSNNPVNKTDPNGYAERIMHEDHREGAQNNGELNDADRPDGDRQPDNDPFQNSPYWVISIGPSSDGTPSAGQDKTASVAGTIYNETGSLRPDKDAAGSPVPGSQESLHDARVAIGTVLMNIAASGRTIQTAPSGVSQAGKQTAAYADSKAAAAQAVANGGDPRGALHYFLRVGPLNTDPKTGQVSGNQPSFARGVKPEASYGPFLNPGAPGDVRGTSNVFVDIYHVP